MKRSNWTHIFYHIFKYMLEWCSGIVSRLNKVRGNTLRLKIATTWWEEVGSTERNHSIAGRHDRLTHESTHTFTHPFIHTQGPAGVVTSGPAKEECSCSSRGTGWPSPSWSPPPSSPPARGQRWTSWCRPRLATRWCVWWPPPVAAAPSLAFVVASWRSSCP